MKRKLTKILGVGLALTLVAGLLLAAVPVSAGTLSFTTETIPSTTGNVLAPGVGVVDLVGASDSTTWYAAPGATKANTLYKSTNTGGTWVPQTVTGNVKAVAIAPDSSDGSFVVILTGANNIYLSTNGGTSWVALHTAAIQAAMANCHAVAISPAVSGIRNVVVGGDDGAGTAELWFINIGATVPSWTDMTSGSWAPVVTGWDTTSTAVRALLFSVNYIADRTMLAVTSDAGIDVDLQLASFAGSKWNVDAGWTGYPVPIVTGVAGLTSVDIATIDTYIGSDPLEQIAFFAINTTDAPATALNGFFRVSGITVKALNTAVSGQSVAYEPSGGKLLCGAASSNAVLRSANPTAATPTLTPASTYKKPGENTTTTNIEVGWAGTTAVAAGQGQHAAFGTSVDDGASWNDLSLVESAVSAIDDIVVNADGSGIYMITRDTTGTDAISLWRKDSDGWARVLCYASTAQWIVRVAPDNWDVVYMGSIGAKTVAYSDDAGATLWKVRLNCGVNIVDMAVESASVVYALSAGGTVSKTTDAGFIWGTAKSTALGNGATITLLSTDNLLVGGTGGGVAYSTNGNTSWTKITPTMVAGNVQVTADGLATGDAIYAVSSGVSSYVYRWKIGTNTTAWTTISGVTNANTGFTGIGLGSDGTLYAMAYDVGTTMSTLYRALSPATATSASMSTASTAAAIQLGQTPQALKTSNTTANKVWAIDVTGLKVYSYTDTLTVGAPTLNAPMDEFTLSMNPATGGGQDIVFQWSRISLATSYQFDLALDSAFTQRVTANIPLTVASSASTVVFMVGPFQPAPANIAFQPGTTYYWRVRVGAPLFTGWSEVRMFNTTTLAPWIPSVVAPAKGATNVSLLPAFNWMPLDGADQYEFELADNSLFKTPIKSIMTAETVFALAVDLEYNTTYFWRVRAVKISGTGMETTVSEEGDWDVATFTTMMEPAGPPPTQPTPTVIIPADEVITPAYIWAIIAIGAVLIIALIILIVRTRRVV
jgi:hypothetical protein